MVILSEYNIWAFTVMKCLIKKQSLCCLNIVCDNILNFMQFCLYCFILHLKSAKIIVYQLLNFLKKIFIILYFSQNSKKRKKTKRNWITPTLEVQTRMISCNFTCVKYMCHLRLELNSVRVRKYCFSMLQHYFSTYCHVYDVNDPLLTLSLQMEQFFLA